MLAPLAAVVLFPCRHRLRLLVPASGGNGPRAGGRQAGCRIRTAASAPAPAGAPGADPCGWRATSPTRRWTLDEFMGRAESMVIQYPELQALTWIDERRRIKATYAAPSVGTSRSAHRRRSPAGRRNRKHLQPGARPAAAGVLAAGRLAAAAPCCNCTFRYPTRAAFRACCWANIPLTACFATACLRGVGQVRGGAAGRQGPRPGGHRRAAAQSRPPASCPGRFASQPNEFEVPVSPGGQRPGSCARRPTAPRWGWWAAACSGWSAP
jgi:hypothetical protein